MRVLSGIQPSGKIHLGNYFSMMQRMIQYQEGGQLFCFIANYHSLTTIKSKKELQNNCLEVAADFLALGLDPERSIFWLQSDVSQVTELAWLLSQHISVPQLELAHSYKDKVSQGFDPSGGLFFYPVLMAADILAFGSERIPVGKDQKQHLEMCRDMARRFNQRYGETFVIPNADILPELAAVPGVDGRKMSKSYNNTICPLAPETELKKSVMSIVTDSKGVNEVKDPENSILYGIYSLFLDDKAKIELADRFRTPGTGYGHIKQELLRTILEYFAKAREKRECLLAQPEELKEILQKGAAKACTVADSFLSKARSNTGLLL